MHLCDEISPRCCTCVAIWCPGAISLSRRGEYQGETSFPQIVSSILGEIRENHDYLDWQCSRAAYVSGNRLVRRASARRRGASLSQAHRRHANGKSSRSRDEEHPAAQCLDVRAV